MSIVQELWCFIAQVPLDPRYTNFLTDIRIPDYKPSALDEIGSLSNDSDEDVIDMSTSSGLNLAPTHNARPKVGHSNKARITTHWPHSTRL